MVTVDGGKALLKTTLTLTGTSVLSFSKVHSRPPLTLHVFTLSLTKTENFKSLPEMYNKLSSCGAFSTNNIKILNKL